jgi:hypothetical protein
MSTIQELASSNTRCRVDGVAGTVASTIWFKTEPLDNTFRYRAAQLQLYTDSGDLGNVPDKSIASSSWFEIVIFPNADSTGPRVVDGKELSWRSHNNTLGLSSHSRHFGIIFDRRGDLLDAIEVRAEAIFLSIV